MTTTNLFTALYNQNKKSGIKFNKKINTYIVDYIKILQAN